MALPRLSTMIRSTNGPAGIETFIGYEFLMVQFHSMNNQIHGHDVMHMMVESQKTFTRETLREAIFEKFGKEARFYTCSRDGMTADELIDFLSAKGKFLGAGDGFRTDSDKICNH